MFSKDAILHVQEKERLFAEALRVLRPGGLLRVGDWLRGDGDELPIQVETFVSAAGHDFTMVSLRETGEIVERAGFTDIELEDEAGLARAESNLAVVQDVAVGVVERRLDRRREPAASYGVRQARAAAERPRPTHPACRCRCLRPAPISPRR